MRRCSPTPIAAGASHQPLSLAGKTAALPLSRDELGLALQQSATAGARELRQRDRSMAWRLAFDHWQREGRGVDNYLPTPSRAPGPQPQTLADFCLAMAAYHDLQLPAPADWQALEALGWQRLAEVRKSGQEPALGPDAKSQLSVVYENGKPVAVSSVVLSTQHAAEFAGDTSVCDGGNQCQAESK
mgnify:CR=1 FL=1